MRVRSPIWILQEVLRGVAAGEKVDLGASRAQLLGIRDQLVAQGRATRTDLLSYVDPYLRVLDVLEAEGFEPAWHLFTEALCAMLGLGTI